VQQAGGGGGKPDAGFLGRHHSTDDSGYGRNGK
jgi:hypothetical protein